MTGKAGRTSRLIERRRKRERLAGVALALLGVAVLVVAIIALHDPNGGRHVNAGSHVTSPSGSHTTAGTHPTTGHKTAAPPRTTSSAPTSRVSPPAQKLPLVVLNNTTTTGLAQSAAERFRAGGWTVTKFTNYQNDIISTCAYYDPAVSGAQASAQALQAQFPTIKRVEPQFSGLSSYASPIVVILTPDYSPN